MCENCKFNDEDEKFLRDRNMSSVASGAMIAEVNEEVADLKKRVEDTNQKLRFLF